MFLIFPLWQNGRERLLEADPNGNTFCAYFWVGPNDPILTLLSCSIPIQEWYYERKIIESCFKTTTYFFSMD